MKPKGKSAAECIAFSIGWDLADMAEQRYQSTRTKHPVYVIGSDYMCCPPVGKEPAGDWDWKPHGIAYGRTVYFAECE